MDKSRRRRLSQDEVDNLVQQAAGRNLRHTAVEAPAPKPARHVAVSATAVAPRPTAAAREEAELRSLQVAVTRLTERLATTERTIGEFQHQVDDIQTSLVQDCQYRKEQSQTVSEIKTLVEGLQNSSIEETVSNLTEHMTAVEGAIGGFEQQVNGIQRSLVAERQAREEHSKAVSEIKTLVEGLQNSSVEETVSNLTEHMTAVEGAIGGFEQQVNGIQRSLVAERQAREEHSKAVSEIKTLVEGLQNSSVEETVSNLTEHMTVVEGAIGGFEQIKEEQSKTISQIWATMEELRGTLPGLTERLAGVENSLGKFEQYGEAMGAALVAGRQFNAERSKVIVSHIRDITRGLQNTLGYNIKRDFKCQSCSANGSVAIHVKCTQCGKENWWGWPRKN